MMKTEAAAARIPGPMPVPGASTRPLALGGDHRSDAEADPR